jgi:TPR repeat protein
MARRVLLIVAIGAALAAQAALAQTTASPATAGTPSTEVAPLTVTGKRSSTEWRPATNPIPPELGAYTELCWQMANDPFLEAVAGMAAARVFLPTRYPRNPDWNAPPLTPPGSPFPPVKTMKDYIRGKPGDPDRKLSVRGKLSDCLGITEGAPSMSRQMNSFAAGVPRTASMDSYGREFLPMGVTRADGFNFSPNGRAQMRGSDRTLPLGFALFDHGRYEEALDQFKRANRKIGDPETYLMIGKIYLYGLRDKSDPLEGVRWLKEITDKAFDRAAQTPQFDPFEPDKTTPNAEAALILAKVYGEGHGPIQKDPALARRYLEIAYHLGHVGAAKTLGDIYYDGVDVAPDRAKAFDYYMKAARFAHADAAVALARMYDAGEVAGGPNHSMALAWYLQAAKIEHPRALEAMAVAYDRGDGVPANPKTALVLYKLAATQGDPAAQAAIGTYFYRGEGGLPRDLALARKWFELAAVGGDADGAFNLAAMQARGEGGAVDRVKAWGWLKIAEKLGHANATAAVAALEAQFTPEDQAGVTVLKRTG